MKYQRAKLRFKGAIKSLESKKPLHQRVIEALISSLDYIKEDDLPANIIDEFNSFMGEMKSVEPQLNESQIKATIMSLSGKQLNAAVDKIRDFANRVSFSQ